MLCGCMCNDAALFHAFDVIFTNMRPLQWLAVGLKAIANVVCIELEPARGAVLAIELLPLAYH